MIVCCCCCCFGQNIIFKKSRTLSDSCGPASTKDFYRVLAAFVSAREREREGERERERKREKERERERERERDSYLYYPRNDILGNSLFLQSILVNLLKNAHKLLLTL